MEMFPLHSTQNLARVASDHGPIFMKLNLSKSSLTNILEILWRQHSRVQWLKEGDLNTRFFHFNASNRRRRNKISRLRDEAENWVVDDEGLGNLVSNYFEAVFTSSQPSQCDEVARNLEVQISDEETISLEKLISPDEVHGGTYINGTIEGSGFISYASYFLSEMLVSFQTYCGFDSVHFFLN
ncbi:hypothetical protein Tco_1518711, partial [Tanacetum coccineum]